MHRNPVLHRDLKPANILVTKSGQVKLLDFGTLKLLDPLTADSALTQAGVRPITLRYANPEYLHGEDVSTLSYIYSLGIVFFRLLAGRIPVGLEAPKKVIAGSPE